MSHFPRNLIVLVALQAFSLALPQRGDTGERYILNGQEALLYKVINWWYHADVDEAAGVCFTVVRIASDKPLTPISDPLSKRMTWAISDFAELVSTHNPQWGATSAESGNKERVELSEGTAGNRLIITLPAANDSASWQQELYPELEGTILGLRDGKVAFYTADDNLYNCRQKQGAEPFKLRVLRQGDPEPIATFTNFTQAR